MDPVQSKPLDISCGFEVDDSVEKFSSSTNNATVKFESLITSASATINEVVIKLSAASNQFSESKKELLTKLDAISTQHTENKKEFLAKFDAIIATLIKVNDGIDNIINKQDETVKQISVHLDNKTSKILESTKELGNKILSLSTDVSNLSQKITESNIELKSEILSLKKQNFILLIVSIAVSLIAVVTNLI